jgi:tRNA pseudouridine38-40 synthase
MTKKQPSVNDASDELLTLALCVSYDGGRFSGFARQPGQTTVQGEIERALAVLLRRDVMTVGAGRTDAGVHARGQVVSFELPSSSMDGRSLERLRSSLNALTPDGLSIRSVEKKPPGFSARFSALAREYRYRVVTSPAEPVFLKPFVWWLPIDRPLDVTAMRRAAKALEGEHDFKSFCVAKSAIDKPTCRRIDRVFIFGAQHLGEHCYVIHVVGNAFLHSMVRVISGSLVEIGLRNKEPEWLEEVLAAKDRRCAGQTAPACGLTFWEVRY